MPFRHFELGVSVGILDFNVKSINEITRHGAVQPAIVLDGRSPHPIQNSVIRSLIVRAKIILDDLLRAHLEEVHPVLVIVFGVGGGIERRQICLRISKDRLELIRINKITEADVEEIVLFPPSDKSVFHRIGNHTRLPRRVLHGFARKNRKMQNG